MGYKFKPAKAVAKRFKVTKTGKLKRHHAFTSHLMSARPANKRRKLRRSAVLFEGHARNMRAMMGLSKLKPAQVAHERALAAKADGRADAGDDSSAGKTATKKPAARAAAAREAKLTPKAPARAGAAKPRT